jgi:hypothetical protein
MILLPRCPAAVGPRTGEPSETLSSHVLSLLTPSCGYSQKWIRQAAGKGLEQMACINYDGDTYYSPSIKSHTSISETSKNQFSLLLSSVTTEDMAVCCCARDTVRGSQCEPRHQPPSGGPMTTSGCWGHTIVCFRSRCRW